MAEEKVKKEEYYTFEVEGQEFRFNKNMANQLYDTFINKAGAGKVATASNNYCIGCIHKDDLVALRNMKKANKGVALQLAGELSGEVAPEVEVIVKKP